MQSKNPQNPFNQNLRQNLWPIHYAQKLTLNNGLAIIIKRRQDTNPLNIITLYAEAQEDLGPHTVGEASLFGTPEKTQFTIQVQEKYRGLGLGKKFFQTLVALARTLGISACTHTPIDPPSKRVLEKLEQLKWMRLEYNADGQLCLHCQFNQRIKI